MARSSAYSPVILEMGEAAAKVTNGGLFRPSDPLRVLGEFLIQKSRELEGKST